MTAPQSQALTTALASLTGLTSSELETVITAAAREKHAQKTAELLDAREQVAALAAKLGIAPADLIAKVKVAPVRDRNQPPRAIKYRDTDSGGVWTGQGHHPKWLKEKIAAGATLEQFAVK